MVVIRLTRVQPLVLSLQHYVKSINRLLNTQEDLRHEKARVQALITEAEELKISAETGSEIIKCLDNDNMNLHFSRKVRTSVVTVNHLSAYTWQV